MELGCTFVWWLWRARGSLCAESPATQNTCRRGAAKPGASSKLVSPYHSTMFTALGPCRLGLREPLRPLRSVVLVLDGDGAEHDIPRAPFRSHGPSLRAGKAAAAAGCFLAVCKQGSRAIRHPYLLASAPCQVRRARNCDSPRLAHSGLRTAHRPISSSCLTRCTRGGHDEAEGDLWGFVLWPLL